MLRLALARDKAKFELDAAEAAFNAAAQLLADLTKTNPTAAVAAAFDYHQAELAHQRAIIAYAHMQIDCAVSRIESSHQRLATHTADQLAKNSADRAADFAEGVECD